MYICHTYRVVAHAASSLSAAVGTCYFAKHKQQILSARAHIRSETIIIPKYHCAAVTPRSVDAQSIVNFHMHDISNHESGKTHYLRSSKPFYLKTRRVFKKPSLKFTKKIRKCRQALIWCAAAFITPKAAGGGIITTGFGTSVLARKKTPWLCVPGRSHQSIN
jgi:hypothetical protein